MVTWIIYKNRNTHTYKDPHRCAQAPQWKQKCRGTMSRPALTLLTFRKMMGNKWDNHHLKWEENSWEKKKRENSTLWCHWLVTEKSVTIIVSIWPPYNPQPRQLGADTIWLWKLHFGGFKGKWVQPHKESSVTMSETSVFRVHRCCKSPQTPPLKTHRCITPELSWVWGLDEASLRQLLRVLPETKLLVNRGPPPVLGSSLTCWLLAESFALQLCPCFHETVAQEPLSSPRTAPRP